MKEINIYMPDPCPKCGEYKVMEIYAGWEPTEFCTEKYVYHCVKCGLVIKKIVNLLTRECEWKKVEFER